MKNEYMVTCVTFENNEIDGADFESPLYGHDYYMDYKPALSEIKNAYGQGWEDVKEIYITTMPENEERTLEEVLLELRESKNYTYLDITEKLNQKGTYIEEKIINKDF